MLAWPGSATIRTMKRSELFFSFLLLPIDIAAILCSFVLAYDLRVKVDLIPANTNVLLTDYLWSGIYLLPVWILFFALASLYKIDRHRNYPSLLYKIFISSSAAILLLIVFIFLNKVSFFSRLILVYTWGLSIVLVFIGRLILDEIRAFLFRYDIGVRRVLCIGTNEVTQKIIAESNRVVSLGMKVIGVINGQHPSNQDFKMLGQIDDLKKILKTHHVDEVILTDMSIPESKISEMILTCSDNNVVFKFIPNIFFMITSHISSKQLAGLPMMEVRGTPLEGWGRIAKRVVDIFVSTLALIISSPFSILAILAIKSTSPGPIIYAHDRIGRDGRKFRLYKFRSMYDKAEEKEKRYWTEAKDTRVTPVGRFIRKTNIDEIPQFVNILFGNMSLVGPRPEQPAFVEKFQKEIPEYYRRHRVKSGLTGWAQVNGLKGDTSIKERVRYDIFYIENWSLWFDLKILLKTIGLIIKEMFGGKYEYRNNS